LGDQVLLGQLAAAARIVKRSEISLKSAVSLGLPVFNGERFLRQSLDSILAQTYEDFELVVSDNASTDSTPDILRDYQRRDQRIRVIRQSTNVGVARNWNAVAQQASGAYFKFVSSNDEYAPALVADCVDVLQRDPSVVLCYGRTQFVSEAGAPMHVHDEDFDALSDAALDRYDVVRMSFTLGTALQAGVVRTGALRRCGYLGNYMHSDRVLTAGLALHGKIVLLPHVHLRRRIGRASSTPQRTPLESERLFRPVARRPSPFGTLRLHAGYARNMLAAPLPVGQRCRGMIKVLRYLYWDKRHMAAELRNLG
jgi:glycosyltransferase involved in cell wall biosynthesis